MSKRRGKRREKVKPLENNGVIEIRYGPGEKIVRSYELVSIHYALNRETGVAVCTLNEPGRLNALTQNQMWEYMLLLRHMERDDDVKVVVWTGRGRAFSSGADLSGKAPPPTLSEDAMEWFEEEGFAPGPASGDMALKSLTLLFWDFPKISIVAVNGLAVGGAANIALANYHDIVLASTEAKFMYPFSKLGLTPELGSSFVLPRVAGMTNAKKMLMLGDWFDANEAHRMGLVSEVHPPRALLPRAISLAETLASRHQQPLRLNKAIINSHLRKDMDKIMDAENRYINDAIQSRFGGGTSRL